MEGIRHLVQCRCILPHLRDKKPAIFHQFVVFSLIDDDDKVVPKQVECNNCGIVHLVTEIGKSKILNSELISSQISIEDIEVSIPQNIATILKSYNADIPTWEEVQYLLENSKSGYVVLKKATLKIDDIEDSVHTGKIMRIENGSVKIESFTRQNYLEQK